MRRSLQNGNHSQGQSSANRQTNGDNDRKNRPLDRLRRNQEGAGLMAYIAVLYSHVQKPTWASGTYQPTVMQSRAYDYEIMNTRSNGSAYEISLRRELVGESASDRCLCRLAGS